MAVEQSCFNNDLELQDFVRRNYRIDVGRVDRVAVGSANCFKLWTEEQILFLKEFQSKFEMDALAREIAVCQLVAKQLPTSEFMTMRSGTVICEEAGRLFHLQRFINGCTYSQNCFDAAMLNREAVLLGKIHRALAGQIELPDGFPDVWFDRWTRERSIEIYRKIAEDKADRSDVVNACETKITLLEAFDLNCEVFKRLTKVNSHGDYNNQQIIVGDDGTMSVIDFSSAAYIPAVWEIIRSYTLSAKECADGDCIDLLGLKRYIDAYLSISSLTLLDVEHMADFYYYHMLRSAFGLFSEDEELLRFALWRTKMCVYLAENRDRIRSFLHDAYSGILK